ncbi:MAG TPA: hypothetical protein VGE50_13915 [Gammaproteobacteria bacterium]
MTPRYVIVLLLVLLTACDSGSNVAGPAVVELGSAEGCDAALQPCRLSHEQAEMTLELEREIRTLQPFHLQLQITGNLQPRIQEVMVEFFMEGMDMGVNRYRLLRDGVSWQGEITLPVCVAGRSDWRAVVEMHTPDGVYRAVYRFHSSG